MNFEENLKKLRKERNLSQIELAEKLGIAPSTIGMYENGSRKPSYEMLEVIADFFNVSIDFLMGKDEKSIYYLSPEVAALAQQLKDNLEMKALFDAAKNVSKEDIDFVIEMLNKMKK